MKSFHEYKELHKQTSQKIDDEISMNLSPEDYILCGEVLADIASEVIHPDNRRLIFQRCSNNDNAVMIRDRLSLLDLLGTAAVLSGIINKEDEAEVLEFACKVFDPSGDIVVSATQIAVKNELQALEELQEETENE